MKIEIDTNTAETVRFCSMWAFPTAFAIALIAAVWHYNVMSFKLAVAAGYTQSAIPGHQGVEWVAGKAKGSP